MKISDLPQPVTAAKCDWLPGTEWLGFSPPGKGPGAKAKCEATIKKQFGKGFVLERITLGFEKPNPDYRNDPRIERERETHKSLADSLLRIHKLELTAMPLERLVGEEEFNWLQDAWSKPEKRTRWSVAFAIVQSFEIVGAPKAKDIFPHDIWEAVFHKQNSGLRTLDDRARSFLADLEIVEVPAPNFWVTLNKDIYAAELSDVSDRALKNMERELTGAMEGQSADTKVKLIRRAAKLANDFVKSRLSQGKLLCEDCKFAPCDRDDLKGFNPRSCLDVHHKNPLSEGKRLTTFADLALLCPTCHRIEHMRMKQVAKSMQEINSEKLAS